MEKAKPKISRGRLPTGELLELCLKGSRGTLEQRNAADSLRSLLVLHLKYKTVTIPAAMRPYFNILDSMN
jgi:hypothetical protein